MSLLTVCPYLACSRLLGSGEEAKEKGTQKVGWAGKRKRFPVFFFFFSFPPFYFRVCAFFNSANPTGGAWNRPRVRGGLNWKCTGQSKLTVIITRCPSVKRGLTVLYKRSTKEVYFVWLHHTVLHRLKWQWILPAVEVQRTQWRSMTTNDDQWRSMTISKRFLLNGYTRN